MAVTMEEIRSLLDRDEPDYEALLARFGPEAIPHLQRMVEGGDPMIASKAAYLASLISDEKSYEVLKLASKSPHATVRIAAAAGVRNLKQAAATAVLDVLLSDQDTGVRKVALRSIEARPELGLKSKVQELAKSDPDQFLRNMARKIVSRKASSRPKKEKNSGKKNTG